MNKIKIDDRAYEVETPGSFVKVHGIFHVLGVAVGCIPYGLWLLLGFLIGYFI